MFRAVWLLTLAVPAFAGESAVLSSGLRLHVDRHEESDGVVRLYRGEGVTEMPVAMVTAFEPDEVAPSPLAPPPALLPAASPPAPAAPFTDPRTLVRAAAARAGLPAAFVESVAKTESGFDPAAVSPKGAIGVMQLMPATAKALGADAHDPEQNIDAGARLLRELLLKYDGDVVKALAAYNAGEQAVDHYHGVPPYPETQHYVDTVVNTYLKGDGQ
jgi:soluble lytic murein transglycosylase-like protein